ncbi:MAG TPA: hypothetical protein VF516_47665, partial [Kofleriaceae bacterium]
MNKPANFEPRSEAPLIKARALVFLRHRRRDLDEALRFYTDFGLELAERSERALYLRAAGGGPICVIIEAAPHDEFAGLAVEAESELALHRLATAAGAPVEQHGEP